MPIILTGARAGSAARRRLAENLLPDPLSKEEALKALNAEIMLRFQEAGIAALSDTTVHGAHCLRVAIRNDRTRRDDLDLRVNEIVRLGHQILNARRSA